MGQILGILTYLSNKNLMISIVSLLFFGIIYDIAKCIQSKFNNNPKQVSDFNTKNKIQSNNIYLYTRISLYLGFSLGFISIMIKTFYIAMNMPVIEKRGADSYIKGNVISVEGSEKYTKILIQAETLNKSTISNKIRLVLKNESVNESTNNLEKHNLLNEKLENKYSYIESTYNDIENTDTTKHNKRHCNNDSFINVGDLLSIKASIYNVPAPCIKGGMDSRYSEFFENVFAHGEVISYTKLESRKAESLKEKIICFLEKSLKNTQINKKDQSSETEKPNISITSTQTSKESEPCKNPYKQRISDSSALILALVFGDRSYLSNETVEAFQKSGIAHSIAISGLHIGCISFLFYIIFKSLICLLYPKLGLSFSIISLSSVISGLFTLTYLKFIKIQLSVIRACIMLIAPLAGYILNRKTDSFRNIEIACLIILAVWPESILYPGFQLSFFASLSLIYLNKVSSKSSIMKSLMINSNRKTISNFLKRIMKYVALSVIYSSFVSFITLPYVTYWFQQITLQPILANIICVPIVLITVCLGIVLMLFMLFNIKIIFLAKSILFLSNLTINLAFFFKDFLNNTIQVHQISHNVIIFWSIGILYIFYINTSHVNSAHRDSGPTIEVSKINTLNTKTSLHTIFSNTVFSKITKLSFTITNFITINSFMNSFLIYLIFFLPFCISIIKKPRRMLIISSKNYAIYENGKLFTKEENYLTHSWARTLGSKMIVTNHVNTYPLEIKSNNSVYYLGRALAYKKTFPCLIYLDKIEVVRWR